MYGDRMDFFSLMETHTPSATFHKKGDLWVVCVGDVVLEGADLNTTATDAIHHHLFSEASVKVQVLMEEPLSLEGLLKNTSESQKILSEFLSIPTSTNSVVDHPLPLGPYPFIDTWLFRLVGHVSVSYGCEAYAYTRRKISFPEVLLGIRSNTVEYHLVGEPTDIKVAQLLLTHLVPKFRELCSEQSKGKGRTRANNLRLETVNKLEEQLVTSNGASDRILKARQWMNDNGVTTT